MDTLWVEVDAKNRASGVFSQVGKDAHHLGSMGPTIGKLFTAGLAVAGAAVVGVGFALGYCVKAAMDNENAMAQTNAGIVSTGGAANVTADHVGKLSDKLAMLSGIDDEIIQQGANVVLTFTNIKNAAGEGNDVFDQTILAAANMSAKLGMDVPAAAMLLGKALNDPVRGMTALRRAGVKLSDEQADLVRSMWKSGDVMGAQKILLAELTTEFGGAAEAAGNTASGGLAKLKIAFDNVAEKIGYALLPLIQRFSDWVMTHQEDIQRFADKIVNGLNMAIDWVSRNWPTISQVLGTIISVMQDIYNIVASVMGFVVGTFQSAAGTIADGCNAIYGVLQSLGAFFQKIFNDIKLSILQGVSGVLTAIEKILEKCSSLPIVGEQFADMHDKVQGALGGVNNEIDETRQRISELDGSAAEGAKQITNSFDKLKGGAVTKFQEMYNTLVNEGKTGAVNLGSAADDAMKRTLNALISNAPGVEGKQAQIVAALIEKIRAGDFQGATAGKIQSMAQALSNSLNVPLPAMEAILGGLVSTITGTDFYGPAANTAKTLGAGITSAKPGVVAAGADLMAGVVSEMDRTIIAQVKAQLDAFVNVNVNTQVGRTLQTGGYVGKTGGYMLHEGEVVLPPAIVNQIKQGKSNFTPGAQNASLVSSGGGITINLSAGAFMGTPGEARRFAALINGYLKQENAR